MAAYIAALGGLGLVVAVLGGLSFVVRGMNGEVAFVMGFLAFMSAVMLAAGGAAVRSSLAVVQRDGDNLRWVDRGKQGMRPRGQLQLVVRVVEPAHIRQFPYYTIALIEQGRGVLVDKLHASPARPLALRRAARIARSLELQAGDRT